MVSLSSNEDNNAGVAIVHLSKTKKNLGETFVIFSSCHASIEVNFFSDCPLCFMLFSHLSKNKTNLGETFVILSSCHASNVVNFFSGSPLHFLFCLKLTCALLKSRDTAFSTRFHVRPVKALINLRIRTS